MSECMTFPDTVEEFMEQYKIVDTERVYTSGAELVPIFRMKQWFEHLSFQEQEVKRSTERLDIISRQDAINALWKAMYEYEDKTEKQFLESKELDVSDWFQHRIFVQNMNDIDRGALLALPSAQPEIIRCKDCKHYKLTDKRAFRLPVQHCEYTGFEDIDDEDFCSRAERKTE